MYGARGEGEAKQSRRGVVARKKQEVEEEDMWNVRRRRKKVRLDRGGGVIIISDADGRTGKRGRERLSSRRRRI